jgi:hypothetical protein
MKPIIAKRAEKRVLLKSRAERLRFKRANTPSQARAPITTSTAAIITSARVPRDKEGA